MNYNEKRIEDEIFMELEEAEKVDVMEEEAGPYSVTYAYGGFLSLICC